jgi:tetratricopeptide (TPR) repeat protein
VTRRPRIMTCLAALAIVLGVSAPTTAREIHQDENISSRVTDVREALALEEYQRAVSLAEQLYADYPDEAVVFWALARAYALAGFDKDRLIPLLEGYLEKNPGDGRATLELGSALAREGRVDEAHETWLAPLRAIAPDIGGYSEIGTLEVRNRMFEHAIETFLEGRSRSGQPLLFSQDLARAYVSTGQNDEAISECLNAVIENPGMVQWGMNVVEGILDTTGDRGLVERWATEIAARSGASPAELSFAGSLFALVGRMDDALEAHALSDERGGRRGMELLEYARLVRDRGMLREAEKALALLLERHPKSAAAAAAGSERAGILVSLGDPEGAAAELKQVADAFAGRPESYAALIDAAKIELTELGDPTAALATLTPFHENADRVARPTLHEAGLVEVDAHLALGELDTAYDQAGAILAGGAEKEIAEQAAYARGFVSFLRGENTTALTELHDMVEQHVGGLLANDALRLMLVISDALETGDAEQTSLYAAALRADAEGDEVTAVALLDSVASRYGGMMVGSEALLRLGALAERRGDARRALDAYERALSESPSIVVKAEARLRRGLILKTVPGRESEAVREFETLLDELPPNYLSGEARRELETLRRQGGGE